ncbi:HigA family addiction module antitoxin (plasmid) [Glutamicibacter mishrai]|uniref:HigA family addiction module antitoxin n=1 Tax=Glutamicibacter mishrai TaxID=1775880 RepID=UPI0032EAC265
MPDMTAILAEAFPAGGYLADELDARGWTQAEFAEILGRPSQFVSEIISGKKEITRESAAQIGAALGTSPEMWLNLQDAYYLWQQKRNPSLLRQLDEVKLRARSNELAPVALLRKRGIISARDAYGEAEQLCELFGMESVFDEPSLPMAARRSNHAEEVSSIQHTWLACAYRQAEGKTVGRFNKSLLTDLAPRVSQIVKRPEGFLDLPADFSEVGVRLIYVEAFPGSKIDGASFLLNDTPVIALSGRGQRLDKVLFTLLHEAAHVVLGHIENGLVVDDADGEQPDSREKEADLLASSWIQKSKMDSLPARISHDWVTRVADKNGIHPIVVTGQLQKAGKVNWRSSLVKGAPTVVSYLQEWENDSL